MKICQVRGIIDSCGSLNNVSRKLFINLVKQSAIVTKPSIIKLIIISLTLFCVRNCSPVTPVMPTSPNSYVLAVNDRNGKYGVSYSFKNLPTTSLTRLTARYGLMPYRHHSLPASHHQAVPSVVS